MIHYYNIFVYVKRKIIDFIVLNLYFCLLDHMSKLYCDHDRDHSYLHSNSWKDPKKLFCSTLSLVISLQRGYQRHTMGTKINGPKKRSVGNVYWFSQDISSKL